MEPRTVRIFISSPGDVVEERQKAQQVIVDLGRRYAGRLALKPILWEELPLMADMSFQQGIEMILHEPVTFAHRLRMHLSIASCGRWACWSAVAIFGAWRPCAAISTTAACSLPP